MTPHKRVRRHRAEAFGKLFHEYTAGLGQSVKLNIRFSKWIAPFKRDDSLHRYVDRADASRDDDESFPFPHHLRHRHGKSDSDPPPSWWGDFFR